MAEEKIWIYHKDGSSKIVLKSSVRGYYEKGWADTPAAFLKKESEDPEGSSFQPPDFQPPDFQPPDSVNVIKPDFVSMTKDDIVEFGATELNLILKDSMSKPEMIEKITKALEKRGYKVE